MKAFYLIPLETTIDPYDGELDTHPKYVNDIKANWTSFHVDGGYAVVAVNTSVLKDFAHQEFKSKPDVIPLDNSQKAKNDLKKIPALAGKDIVGDEVEFLGKTKYPNFNKDSHLFVREG